MKSILKIGATGILALVTAGGLCGQEKHDPSEKNQIHLQKEVRHELVTLPFYNVFDNFEYKIDGNTVTLMGQVTRPNLKSDAEKAVKGIEGVERVVNNIEVLPLSPMDDQIRMAEYRAIYGDPAISTRYGYRAQPSIHLVAVQKGGIPSFARRDSLRKHFDNFIEIRSRQVAVWIRAPDRFEKFVLGDLQKLVTRMFFQERHQRLSHMAQGIEAGARHHVFYLPSKKRNFRWMRTIGCRSIEAEKPMFAGDLAVGIETLDADIVEVPRTMNRSARIRLG